MKSLSITRWAVLSLAGSGACSPVVGGSENGGGSASTHWSGNGGALSSTGTTTGSASLEGGGGRAAALTGSSALGGAGVTTGTAVGGTAGGATAGVGPSGRGGAGGASSPDSGGSLGLPSGGSGGTDAGGASGVGGATGVAGEDTGVGGSELSGPWPPSPTFQNPVLWNDLADDEVIRVGDAYYYTASNMHYSPGAPILRSYDLVNWEYAGHAIPVLDFAPKYDLTGGHAYIKGTWASTLQYRESNQTFYWLGCIEFGKTYVYTAQAVEGPWEKHPAINNCYYDAGMLVDDDDTLYVAYGNTDISVAELGDDGLSQVHAELVYSSNDMTLEGSRFYKRDGYYYIFVTRPADGQFILRSDSPWGPYERHALIDRNSAPVSGAGVPHQGGLVETQNGDWYYMAFIDSYPGGRVPVLAPVTWGEDGWPSVELVDGDWAESYPYPDVPRPPRATKPHTGTETFAGPSLGHEWEWNHNPDNTKWSFDGGLALATATVTSDLYAARNTLTRRILGPASTGTIQVDVSQMQDGDVAGLALLRHFSAYVAVEKSGGATRIVMFNGLAMDGSWNTTSTGTEAASAALSGSTVWLRLTADIRPGTGRLGEFSYSTDGTSFTPIGPGYAMNNQWQFFMGYRFGVFNFAKTSLGGRVTVKSFTLTAP